MTSQNDPHLCEEEEQEPIVWQTQDERQQLLLQIASDAEGSGSFTSCLLAECRAQGLISERLGTALIVVSLECPYEHIRTLYLNALAESCKCKESAGRGLLRAIPDVAATIGAWADDAQREAEEEGADPHERLTAYLEQIRYISRFTHPHLLPSPTTEEPITAAFFRRVYRSYGRIPHLHRVLSWHPQFSGRLLDTEEVLMHAGPLTSHESHYVALLGASIHFCSYLMYRESRSFLQCHGPEEWLDDITNAPVALQKLAEYNAILAHQPWLIKPEDMKELVKAGWGWNHIAQACVILAHTHALCGVVHGLGITAEEGDDSIWTTAAEYPEETGIYTVDTTPPPKPTMSKTKRKKLLKKSGDSEATDHILHLMNDSYPTSTSSRTLCPTHTSNEDTAQTNQDMNNHTNHNDEGDPNDKQEDLLAAACVETIQQTSTTNTPDMTNAACSKYYVPNPHKVVRYSDFETTRSHSNGEISYLSICEYDWKNGVYPSLSDFDLDNLAKLLDAEFDFVQQMTTMNFGDKVDVDTSNFRRMVWLYTHKVYGINYDDYDYHAVNSLFTDVNLLKMVKGFIKKVVCYPEKLKADHFVEWRFLLSPEEKAHVALLAVEARKQAEIMFAIQAVSGCQRL